MAVLIFDFDGTIHDSMRIYEPAVRFCQDLFVRQGVLKPRPLSRAEIRRYLGLTAAEMWDAFAPELPREKKEEGSRIIGEDMRRRIAAGQARLYEGTQEMLRQLLEEGHVPVFLSNCSVAYMTAHARAFHLTEYFREMYCAEQFQWAEKTKIVKTLLPSWQPPVIATRDHPTKAAGDALTMAATDGCPPVIATRDHPTKASGDALTLAATDGCPPVIATRDHPMKAAGDALTMAATDGCPPVIAIGDRYKDMEIASVGDIRTVWCSYGFGDPGEGDAADVTAQNVMDIPACIHRLLQI